jgi:hypothetical protein
MALLLTQNATNSLKTRAQFIPGQLLRCLASFHIPLDTETVTEALGLLRQAIQTVTSNIGFRLFQYPVFSFPSFAQAKNHCQTQYGCAGPKQEEQACRAETHAQAAKELWLRPNKLVTDEPRSYASAPNTPSIVDKRGWCLVLAASHCIFNGQHHLTSAKTHRAFRGLGEAEIAKSSPRREPDVSAELLRA